MVAEENAELGASGAEALQWSVRAAGEEIDIAIAGEMDLASAGPLTRAISRVLETKPVTVRIDLAGVSFLDSSGIRCLLDASRRAESTGSHLVVRNPTPMVLRVMEICAVDHLLLGNGKTDGDGARVDRAHVDGQVADARTESEPRAPDDA
jgi:anti-anti-sigma factor